MTATSQVTIENLISTGAHFGHVTSRWHPNYQPYIYMEKNGIHIIDVKQTIQLLYKAIEVITQIVRDGGTVLFVGTKKQARDILQREADRCGMYYVVERWLGGTLTNFATIKRSVKRLEQLEKEADVLYQSLTKKEILHLERERIRLADLHRGIRDMKQLPDMVYVVDAHHESTAVKEARRLEIPVVGIVDTNTDPGVVDYPIPANDDSLRTIQLISSALADAIIAARGGESFAVSVEGEPSAAKDLTELQSGVESETTPMEAVNPEDDRMAQEKVAAGVDKLGEETPEATEEIASNGKAASSTRKQKAGTESEDKAEQNEEEEKGTLEEKDKT
jgi:small subunit ribosomal protein S2